MKILVKIEGHGQRAFREMEWKEALKLARELLPEGWSIEMRMEQIPDSGPEALYDPPYFSSDPRVEEKWDK